MAVIKNPDDLSNATNYVATIAFFCCISCVTLMIRFGGFKASLNIFNSKKNEESNDNNCGLYMNGAYRTNRDEFFGNGRISDPPRKLTPSMVSLPPREESLTAVKHTKSTSDLSKSNSSQQLRQSTPNVSADPRGGDPDNISNYQRNLKLQEKEQKRLEKQRLAEQKERDKAAAKEQAKQDKMREKARKEAETKAKRDKRKAPAPQQVRATAQTKPSIPQAERTNPAPKTNATYSSNTLESSISRSSGPPPYSERVQTNIEQSATSSNVTFSKPIDASSWDMISAHRQQLSRTTYEGKKHNKQTVMDLNYNFSNTIKEERDNSEV